VFGQTYAGPGKDKGGFSSYIRYNAEFVFPIPEGLASEHAAPLLCAGITTFSPLKRHCKPGMKVGVIGIGGLGHIAIQIAKAMGCEVTAISRSNAKEEEARGFGATGFVSTGDPDSVAAAKGSLHVILHTASGVTGMDTYHALLSTPHILCPCMVITAL